MAKNVTKNVVVTETSHRDLSIEDKKTLGQISAAKRSVITNVVVVAVTFCVNVVMTLPVVSKDLLPFLSVITFSSIKGLLQILTTLANFGTTNNLMHQYWCELKETIKINLFWGKGSCCHSSEDSFAPTILPLWVRITSTTSTLLS